MTDAEIVALVMAFDDAYWANRDKGGEPGNMKAGIRAVVAALTEAGRLRGVDRKLRDAIEHLLLFVEQGEHGWTIEGKAATVRAWLDAEPTP